MGGVLTDWQKAVNTIAHALNKAGYDGDSPESKALELLAGRCEGTADAKEIAAAAVDANTMYQREYLPSHYAQYGEFGDSDHLVLRVDYIAEAIAPLLKPSVDVGKLANELCKNLWEHHRMMGSSIRKEFTDIISDSLTDSAGETELLRAERINLRSDLSYALGMIKGAFETRECSCDDEQCKRCDVLGYVEVLKSKHSLGAALSGGAEKEGE